MSAAVLDPVRTEFSFTLPVGYVDDGGVRHRSGVMRLATARDEILPLRDPRVQDNEAYLTVILLSRVITSLGTLSAINPGVIEGMFAADLAMLQDLYRRVNAEGHTRAAVACPSCSHEFAVDVSGGGPGGAPAGES
ncbi:MAG TPA: phage tail assembly protein [Jatrophihabitantaceae bacterium]|jgi:hypothetical protein